MARKANISREEIHQACWSLLEENHFPNIPRIADYFLAKDGRKCSNTTLMNAIAEWEELYKEHQQHKLRELDDGLQPAFQRFSRDVTQALGQLLDEKILETESQHALKQAATQGQYQSLTSALCDLQISFDELSDKHAQVMLENTEFKHRNSQLQERYEDVYAHNQVLASQLKKTNAEKEELRVNLSQHEVDLAKSDHLTAQLEEQNTQLRDDNQALRAQVQSLQADQKESNKQHLSQLNQKLEEMAICIQQIQVKDRDTKQ